MFNSLLTYLQNFGYPKIQSSVPQENFLNTSQKMNQYKTADDQMQQMQQYHPNTYLNRDQFINNSMQFGNATPALLNNIAYQQQSDQYAKQALAQPTPQPTAMPTTMPTATPTPQQPNILQIAQNALQVFRPHPAVAQTPQTPAQIFQQYGISPQVGLGILQAEGGRIGTNNPGNINATDSNPNGAYNYATPQAGITAAAQTMQNLLKKRGITSGDPAVQLQGIEQAGYAGDPRTWQRRSAAQGGAGKTYKHWSDFVRATNAWNQD